VVPVVGPFLLLGVLAWVVAIGMGVGSWFGLSDWRRRWAIAGALAGLGTFEIFLYAHGGNLPVFIARPNMVFSATALLFVGSGVAAAYGTLFAPDSAVRPALDAGSAEERLWLHDAVDRLRPTRGDWGLTAVLALPALGMLHLGLNLAPAAELVAVGGAPGPALRLARAPSAEARDGPVPCRAHGVGCGDDAVIERRRIGGRGRNRERRPACSDGTVTNGIGAGRGSFDWS
jgi:hypothetical protein